MGPRTAAVLVFIWGCGGGGPGEGAEPVYFDPPPGEYDGPQSVSIVALDHAAQIFYTTDGSTPTTASAAYTGEAIAVDDNCDTTAIEVMWVDEEGAETSGIRGDYYLDDGTCEVVEYINDQLLMAWFEYETATRCEMNGCQDPSATGSWRYDCSNGGSIDWTVTLDGTCGVFAVISTFDYNGCEYTISDGTTLVADGQIVGDFCTDHHGTTTGNVDFTGDWTGAIEDNITIDTNDEKVDGYYWVACANEGCAPDSEPMKYVAPFWDCVTCGSDGAGGEDTGDTGGAGDWAGWYTIRNKSRGECLTEDAGDVFYSDCDGGGDQQFTLTDDGASWYIHPGLSPTWCVHDDANSNDVDAQTCQDDPRYRWILSGSGDDVKIQNEETGDCMYGLDIFNSDVTSWIGCGLVTDLLWGFYEGGEGSAVDPGSLRSD